MKVYFETLGCPKNFNDTQAAEGFLLNGGYELAETPEDADFIVVNTCGFINDAKRESIDISAISRIIKKETGHTFKELLQTKRLELACVLLEHSNAPIADIALSVGYDNTSFFHRIFRRIYGCSPREYRIQKA